MEDQYQIPRLTCKFRMILDGKETEFSSCDSKDSQLLPNFTYERYFEGIGNRLNRLIEKNNLGFQFKVERRHLNKPFLTVQRKEESTSEFKQKLEPKRSEAYLLSTQLTRQNSIDLHELLHQNLLEDITQDEFVLKIEFLNKCMLKQELYINDMPKRELSSDDALKPKLSLDDIWNTSIKPKIPIVHTYNASLKKVVYAFFNEYLGSSVGGAARAFAPISEYAETGLPSLDEKRTKEIDLIIHSEDIYIALGKAMDSDGFEWCYQQLHESFPAIGSIEDISKHRKVPKSAYLKLGKMFYEAINKAVIKEGTYKDFPVGFGLSIDTIYGNRQFDKGFEKKYPDFIRKFKLSLTRHLASLFYSASAARHPEEEEIGRPFTLANENDINSEFLNVTRIYIKTLQALGFKEQFQLPKESDKRKYISLHFQAKKELMNLDKLYTGIVSRVPQEETRIAIEYKEKKGKNKDIGKDKDKDKTKIDRKAERSISLSASIANTSPIYNSTSTTTTSAAAPSLPAADSDAKSEGSAARI